MKDDTRSQSRRKGRYAVRGKVSERWWAAEGVEMTDAGSRAVDGTLAFLNAGDWLEPAVAAIISGAASAYRFCAARAAPRRPCV